MVLAAKEIPAHNYEKEEALGRAKANFVDVGKDPIKTNPKSKTTI